MLEKKKKKIKGVKIEENDVVLNISKEGYIPDDYIKEEEKIVVYKRILQVSSVDELKELKKELIDRFGKMPIEVENLFNYNKIKLFSKEIGLREIEERDGSFVIKINENVFNVDKLNELIVGNRIKYLGKENAVMVKNLEEFFREFREEE